MEKYGKSTVLICDDEELICDLIIRLIDWEALNLHILKICKNGLEAYDEIVKNNPDIVITDICMPEMDGLQLIEKCVKNNYNTHFILISGHQDFQYAYSAIKYGVKNYILKPIRKVELENSLIAIKETLHKKQNIESTLAQKTEIIHQYFINTLISSKLNSYSPSEILDEFGIEFVPSSFRVLLLHFDRLTFRINHEELFFLQKQAIKIFKERYENIFAHCLIGINNNTIVIVLNNKLEEFVDQKSIRRILTYMKERLNISKQYLITLAVGQQVKLVENLYASYKNAEDALKARLQTGADRVIFNENQFQSLAPQSIMTEARRKSFANVIEQLDTIAIDEWLDNYFQSIISNRAQEVNTVFFDSLYYLVIYFHELITKYNLIIPDENFSIAIIEKYYGSINLTELCWNIKGEIHNYITRYKDYIGKKDIAPIHKAKNYIKEHYKDEITLEDVASHIHLNPIYFSRLFKEKTGQTFMQYLTEIRMEKAKDYLINTDMSINEIANSVGYQDSKYFSRIFKKECKIIPNLYRKMHGK